MTPPTDTISACLLHWVRTCESMHTPTWDEWGKQTREALEERQRELLYAHTQVPKVAIDKTGVDVV